MSNIDVIRAWKDEGYRASLSEAERSALPAHPAGPMELRDEDLQMATGGVSAGPACTSCCRCPDGYSWDSSCCSL